MLTMMMMMMVQLPRTEARPAAAAAAAWPAGWRPCVVAALILQHY
jgi:hypothetical protein